MSTLLVVVLVVVVVVAQSTIAAPSQEFVIQTSVYVDHLGFKQWENISRKTSENEMKTALKSSVLKSQDWFKSLQTMAPPLTIKIDVTQVVVLTKEEMAFKVKQNTNKLDYALGSMYSFSKWAHNQTQKTDLAILFTGYEIGTRIAGVAQTEGICSDLSVAFVPLKRYASPYVIAHEIAHVLGAVHDGEPPASNCPPYTTGGSVMAPSYYSFRKVVPFSKCSHRSIHDLLVTRGNGKCLLDLNLDREVTTTEKPRVVVIPSLPNTADEACRDVKGEDGWTLDRVRYRGKYGDKFCVDFTCTKVIQGYLHVFQAGKAPNGLRCGKNKRCYEGQCLESPNGDPSMVDWCPWGSHRLEDVNLQRHFKSCSDACYASYKYICCGHCDKDTVIGK